MINDSDEDPFGLPRAQDEDQDPFSSFGQSEVVKVPLHSPGEKTPSFDSFEVMASPFGTEDDSFGQSLQVKNESAAEDLVQDDFQTQEKGQISIGK